GPDAFGPQMVFGGTRALNQTRFRFRSHPLSTPPRPAPLPPPPPRLLDLVRHVAPTRFGPEGPGERSAHGTRRRVLGHDPRHPGGVCRRREHVAQTATGPRDGLAEAPTALPFRDHDVLGLDLGELPFPDLPRLRDRRHRAVGSA